MKYLQSKSVFEHLKTFESLSVDTLREDLTEICYELTDGGRFDIKIYDDSDFPGWGHIPGSGMNVPRVERDDKILCIYLSNHMDYDGFSFAEVREVILRVIDYLGDRYKGCSVLHVGETNRLWTINQDINLANLIIIYR